MPNFRSVRIRTDKWVYSNNSSWRACLGHGCGICERYKRLVESVRSLLMQHDRIRWGDRELLSITRKNICQCWLYDLVLSFVNSVSAMMMRIIILRLINKGHQTHLLCIWESTLLCKIPLSEAKCWICCRSNDARNWYNSYIFLAFATSSRAWKKRVDNGPQRQ